ncbi:LlaJI family restriction endonuclease [Pseudoalteromonas sp. S327]|uniref:LlaJI family restriction endonuclease n=1 Tax=unclassified Pseudoalteromonas TaxID=194690 RepID=UPI0006D68D21|nr:MULTISPECIES: LlaJI family restriction endonuclease [unclassified Pseudoalteromonas]KPZ61459.1 Type-2 restriction enzyme BsuMI component YdjA [Pseudoalteromonas sp. P1-7a]TMO05628.1 LlaJI family restriction endonuclease [Pseudoalteromonas sp. S327]TMO19482.1 LlaJI family restriction endonuclease [Pseudoalteromonas sp. S326]
MRKLYLFEDRQSIVKAMPKKLVQNLNKQGLLYGNGQKVMFCGLINFDDQIAVFLPRNSDYVEIDESSTKKVCATLLKALKRYLDDKDNAISADELVDEGIHGQEYLGLIFALFEDYFNNGLFTRRVSERKVNSGKVDWNRTIKQSIPYTSGDSPVYLELAGSIKRVYSNCETAKIHAEVLRNLDQKVGWLINDDDGAITKQLIDVPTSLMGNDAKIYHLNNELTRAYSDRDIYLIKQLISYLKLESMSQKSDFSIGVKRFEGMWEHMLSKTLKNIFPINKKLAKPVYKINGELKLASRKGQRTDIVLRDPYTEDFTVIDAKYYAAKSLETAPGWPDLVKQFFYAKAVKSIYPDNNVSNMFIFPGNNGPIESAYMAEPNMKNILEEDLLDDYPVIICSFIEPLEVIKSFVFKQLIKL